MTPRLPPKCAECQKTETLLWRSTENGQICQECFELQEKSTLESTEDGSELTKSKDEKQRDAKEKDDGVQVAGAELKTSAAISEEKRLRKSTRATRFKNRCSASSAAAAGNHANGSASSAGGGNGVGATGGSKSQAKGRNRRNLFKKTPFKTPVTQATTHSAESVFHKGSYLQIGDIVSLVDNDQNVYYAQIRGLLVDNYCEKSAFLTWLIPTQASPDPREAFDAATYLIGPDEDLARKLSCLEFVMHAPSNYYLDRTTPFPLPDTMVTADSKPCGYIWTTLPEQQRKKSIS